MPREGRRDKTVFRLFSLIVFLSTFPSAIKDQTRFVLFGSFPPVLREKEKETQTERERERERERGRKKEREEEKDSDVMKPCIATREEEK